MVGLDTVGMMIGMEGTGGMGGRDGAVVAVAVVVRGEVEQGVSQGGVERRGDIEDSIE